MKTPTTQPITGTVHVNGKEYKYTESEYMVHEAISPKVFQAEFIRPFRAFNKEHGKYYKIVKQENPTSYQIIGGKNGNNVQLFVNAIKFSFGYSVRYDSRMFTKEDKKQTTRRS
tara:strand:+ start:18 stop:359 length:342 start_codon:yes stop_codon:yes gene_type:complete